MQYDLLIIGGGVSGFAAAIAAARRHKTVCILEQNRKPLRKLAASGNGRGNLFHLQPSADRYHGDSDFAMQVLGPNAPQEAASFWKSIGVSLAVEQENLVYPSSFWAQSAVDALVHEAELLGVHVQLNTCAQHILIKPNSYAVTGLQCFLSPDSHGKRKDIKTEEQTFCYESKKLLVCGGGKASLRSDAPDCYTLMQETGHTITTLFPSLCALCTQQTPPAALQGSRVRCICTLRDHDGNCKRTSVGEALFAKDGISGIAVMDLARNAKAEDILSLNLTEAICGEKDKSLSDWLKERRSLRENDICRHFLIGCAHPALSAELLRRCGLREEQPVASLSNQMLQKLSEAITDFHFTLTGPRPMEVAQVTAGGVSTEEFSANTLQSRQHPGLYAAGELLNVDGDCGGFNILFATISGLRVGNAI